MLIRNFSFVSSDNDFCDSIVQLCVHIIVSININSSMFSSSNNSRSSSILCIKMILEFRTIILKRENYF